MGPWFPFDDEYHIANWANSLIIGRPSALQTLRLPWRASPPIPLVSTAREQPHYSQIKSRSNAFLRDNKCIRKIKKVFFILREQLPLQQISSITWALLRSPPRETRDAPEIHQVKYHGADVHGRQTPGKQREVGRPQEASSLSMISSSKQQL